jgi:hypothetical protein
VHPGDKVWLLEVRDEGNLVFRTVHSSHEAAVKFLAQWCRDSWREQGHGQGPNYEETIDVALSNNDKRAIERYFEFWSPEEGYDIDMEGVDPDPREVTP